MELTTQIIIGIITLLSIGILVILFKVYMSIDSKPTTEQLGTANSIESFLDIDLDTLINLPRTKPINVHELEKKLNQFKNRNRFYNL